MGNSGKWVGGWTTRFLLLLAGLAANADAAEPVSVQWFYFDPMAIRSTRFEPVLFRAKIEGNPSSVQLALAEGPTVSLTTAGDGIWSVTLTASSVLFDYQADDVNRNFVGDLDVFQDGQLVARVFAFINVLDANVPAVPVVSLGTRIRWSPRIVNLWCPDHAPEPNDPIPTLQIPLLQKFYELFADDYDFINLVYEVPRLPVGAGYNHVKNDVAGIGAVLFDHTAVARVGGRLQGWMSYPEYFDLAGPTSLHELGHQWINYLKVPILATRYKHWPLSSLARSPMALDSVSYFPFDLVPLGDGRYRLQAVEGWGEYTDLDLYLMGLLPASQVGPHIVFVNQDQAPQSFGFDGGILEGPVQTVTVNDIISVHGPRIPDVSSSQKSFRVATIVVTRERLLDRDEMALLDYFAARGEAEVPLPFSIGHPKGTTKPFYVATRGLGRLATALSPPCQGTPPPPRSSLSVTRTRTRADTVTFAVSGLVGETAAVLFSRTDAGGTFMGHPLSLGPDWRFLFTCRLSRVGTCAQSYTYPKTTSGTVFFQAVRSYDPTFRLSPSISLTNGACLTGFQAPAAPVVGLR
jgi:hypothetical protein